MSAWQRWLEHPEKSWVRNAFYQIHLWVGVGASAYILFISVSGSMIVYRNELSGRFSIEWLVNLHENLLAGSAGRLVNGVGAICLTLLCLTGAFIWWPGIKYWRRSLTVNWRAHFARITWDLHSALGFWFLFFIFVWGISGIYFSFPQVFTALPDQGLSWLTQLHFGRLGWFAEALWTLSGLVPAVLSFTGVFICCRRVMYKKPSNPNREQASSVSLLKTKQI
jgi:uncharacterized iron-regulated membrane protein